MNQFSPLSPEVSRSRCRAVALLVDGDQFPSSLAGRAILQARELGALAILQIYGSAILSDDWLALGFHPIRLHPGKNVTDMALTVAAMELSFAGTIDGFVIASQDSDFVPLIRSLRARGFPVWGLSQGAMPRHFTAAFTRCVQLQPSTSKTTLMPHPKPLPVPNPVVPKPATSDLRSVVQSILASGPKSPEDFGTQMTQRKICIPKGSARWQGWLRVHADYVVITGSGAQTRFTLKA